MCFICPGCLVHFMRNRLEHLQSPSAPTQPTHTHLSHTARCTKSNCTCIRTQEKQKPHFSMQIACTQVTNSHKHTTVLGCVTSCRDRTTGKRLALRGFAKHFLLRLTFLLRHALINILYGFYMDLFSLFSYSVPEEPWPRSPVSLMTVGEQSIFCNTSNYSTAPTWCLRLEKIYIKSQKNVLGRVSV